MCSYILTHGWFLACREHRFEFIFIISKELLNYIINKQQQLQIRKFIGRVFIINMKQYKYRAFGFNIISDFEMPELMKGNGIVDIEITKGNIEEIEDDLLEDKIIKSSENEIVYQLKDIAGCKVINGKRVIIMPSPNLGHTTLRLFILTSVLGCILIQKKVPAIHGSCVVIGDKCIIIAGDSGAGKSTITSEFILQGYTFLSDDVSVIYDDKLGNLCVQPGVPYRKLHKDSALHYSINTENCEKIEYEEEKYLIPLHKSFENTPKKLCALVEIVPKEVDDVYIEKLKGIEKLNILMNNLYRGRLTAHFKSREFYFKLIGDIAARLDVYRIIRPKDRFTCDKQVELIINKLLD